MCFSMTVFLILLGSYNLDNGNTLFYFYQMVPQAVPKISEILFFVPVGFSGELFCICCNMLPD